MAFVPNRSNWNRASSWLLPLTTVICLAFSRSDSIRTNRWKKSGPKRGNVRHQCPPRSLVCDRVFLCSPSTNQTSYDISRAWWVASFQGYLWHNKRREKVMRTGLGSHRLRFLRWKGSQVGSGRLHTRGFHIGWRAVVFWADVKNSTVGFNVKFWRRRQKHNRALPMWKPLYALQPSWWADLPWPTLPHLQPGAKAPDFATGQPHAYNEHSQFQPNTATFPNSVTLFFANANAMVLNWPDTENCSQVEFAFCVCRNSPTCKCGCCYGKKFSESLVS